MSTVGAKAEGTACDTMAAMLSLACKELMAELKDHVKQAKANGGGAGGKGGRKSR